MATVKKDNTKQTEKKENVTFKKGTTSKKEVVGPVSLANKKTKTKTTVDPQVVEKPVVIKEEALTPKKDKPRADFVTIKPKKMPVTEDSIATKKFAWLAYILFFIPLCIDRKSAFVRHNANEGLEINVFDLLGLTLLLVGSLVKSESVTWHGVLVICVIIGAGILALTTVTKVYMIILSAQGKQVSTPWMWGLRIIK